MAICLAVREEGEEKGGNKEDYRICVLKHWWLFHDKLATLYVSAKISSKEASRLHTGQKENVRTL